jgi:hypothetical protein
MSRPGRVIVSLALILELVGCESAVSGWRSVTGVNKNDPDPQTAPFTENMAAAAGGGYPNLASVPEPPTIATSSADRQKLTDTLVAERGATAAAGSIPAMTPSAVPPGAKPAPASPSATPPAGAAVPTAATAERVPGKQAANSPVLGTTGTNAPGVTRRRQDEPPEPQPRDSSLTMPTIPGPLPQPEATQPPPPVPALPAVPAPVVVPPMPPAAVATATPAPPPPVPVLAPIVPPPPPPTPSPKAATAKPAPPKTTVATLDVAASGPGAGERAEIERVATLYKETPRTVRVVAFAAAPVGGADPLASYHAALERAQAVAKELTAAGIPSTKVQTEASPTAGTGSGRIEIQFLP